MYKHCYTKRFVNGVNGIEGMKRCLQPEASINNNCCFILGHMCNFRVSYWRKNVKMCELLINTDFFSKFCVFVSVKSAYNYSKRSVPKENTSKTMGSKDYFTLIENNVAKF